MASGRYRTQEIGSLAACLGSNIRSCSRLHIFDVILWYAFLFWLFAIFFTSFLKVSHSICGLFVSWSVFMFLSSAMSSWSFIPCWMTFSIVFRSSIIPSGQVQQPLPVRGASFGVYFIYTSQWSIGTDDAFIFQAKVWG